MAEWLIHGLRSLLAPLPGGADRGRDPNQTGAGMSEILRAIGLGPKTESRHILQVLKRLERTRTPVLMEVEGRQTHFRSVIAVKKGVIVVAKPDGLVGQLRKEDVVRFSVPLEESKDLRLQVLTPHFNLTSGSAVFLCRVPEAFTEGSRRRSVRFNTSRFKNLHLYLPALEDRFRIVDLSTTGCKIHHNRSDVGELLPLNRLIAPAKLEISRYTADLEGVVPRVHKGQTVGCEMHVPSYGNARKYIEHLVQSLLKSEEQRLHSEAI